MKKLILTFIMILTFVCAAFAQQYVTDLVVTSESGIWTDARAFSTLSDAITAIGASNQTLYIVEQEDFTGTIPATVRLKFGGSGSINAIGAVTISTRNIDAPNHRIFYGAGAYDFGVGAELDSSWFEDFDEAIAETSDDEVTIIMSESEQATASAALGGDVVLKWTAPGNELVIDSGVVISNINKIDAGDYVIALGVGRLDFNDGMVVKSTWFRRLRTALRHIDDSKVYLEIRKSETLDYSYSVNANTTLKFEQGNVITIGAGKTLTVGGYDNIVAAVDQDIFAGAGSVAFSDTTKNSNIIWDYSQSKFDMTDAYYYPDHEETDQGVVGSGNTIKSIADSVGTGKRTIVVLQHFGSEGNTTTYTLSTALDLTTYPYFYIRVEPGAILSLGDTLTVYSPDNILAQPNQAILTSSVNIPLAFAAGGTAYGPWWGIVGDGTTDNTYTTMRKAIQRPWSSDGGRIHFPAGTYIIDAESNMAFRFSSVNNVQLTGDGWQTIFKIKAASDPNYGIYILDSSGLILRDFKLDMNGTNQTAGNCQGIYCYDASNIVVDNVWVHDADFGAVCYSVLIGIDDGATENIWVRNCKVSKLGDSGITIVGGDKIFIESNLVDGDDSTSTPGIHIEPDDPINDIVVKGNIIYNLDSGGIYAYSDGTALNNLSIDGNVVHKISGGIRVSGATNWSITNNLVHTFSLWGICLGQSSKNANDGLVHGNMIYDCDGAATEYGIYVTFGARDTIVNNVIQDSQAKLDYGIYESSDTTGPHYIHSNEIGTVQTTPLYIYTAAGSVIGHNNGAYEETVTAAAPTAQWWGLTRVDTSSNDITLTVPDAATTGTIKIVELTDNTNAADGGTTIVCTHHEDGDPTTYTPKANEDYVVLVWSRNRWVELDADMTL